MPSFTWLSYWWSVRPSDAASGLLVSSWTWVRWCDASLAEHCRLREFRLLGVPSIFLEFCSFHGRCPVPGTTWCTPFSLAGTIAGQAKSAFVSSSPAQWHSHRRYVACAEWRCSVRYQTMKPPHWFHESTCLTSWKKNRQTCRIGLHNWFSRELGSTPTLAVAESPCSRRAPKVFSCNGSCKNQWVPFVLS